MGIRPGLQGAAAMRSRNMAVMELPRLPTMVRRKRQG